MVKGDLKLLHQMKNLDVQLEKSKLIMETEALFIERKSRRREQNSKLDGWNKLIPIILQRPTSKNNGFFRVKFLENEARLLQLCFTNYHSAAQISGIFSTDIGVGQTGVDPEIKLTVTKLEKNIRKDGAVLGYHALSLLNALQENRPTKSEYKLQA